VYTCLGQKYVVASKVLKKHNEKAFNKINLYIGTIYLPEKLSRHGGEIMQGYLPIVQIYGLALVSHGHL